MKRKTMALLVVLAKHQGVVLTNQELLDALWTGEFMTMEDWLIMVLLPDMRKSIWRSVSSRRK